MEKSIESIAHLVSAFAAFAWPLIFVAALIFFAKDLKKIIQSANNRKFTIKLGGNEVSMEEVSEQQRALWKDLQIKLSELEQRMPVLKNINDEYELMPSFIGHHILWVDDNPSNNSYLVALLIDRGYIVHAVNSTDAGLNAFKKNRYHLVISDMDRPEGERAGIDFAKKVRSLDRSVPIYIFCGEWAAKNLKQESLDAGVNMITSSGISLIGAAFSNKKGASTQKPSH